MATQAPKTRKTRRSEWLLGRFLYLRFLIVKRATNFRITKTDGHRGQHNVIAQRALASPHPSRRTLPLSKKPKTICRARMRTAENMQNLIKANRQFVFRPSFSLLWFLPSLCSMRKDIGTSTVDVLMLAICCKTVYLSFYFGALRKHRNKTLLDFIRWIWVH